MDQLSLRPAFDAEDKKVYRAWLKRILIGYGAVMFCVLATMTVQAMSGATAEFLQTTLALASP